MTRRFAIYLVAVLVGAVGFVSTEAAPRGKRSGEDPTQTKVQRLLGEAERAELAGDAAKREALLREVLTVDPDSKLARWQLGQVEADGDWQSVSDVQQQTAADPKYAEYVDLRNQYGDTGEGHLALARWCKRQGLSQEAAFHWAAVLGYQPNHEEALRQLGKQWFHGRLVTYDERSRIQKDWKQARKAGQKWSTKLAGWERVLKSDDTLERYAALTEIRAIEDPNAIAEMEAATLPNKWADERNVERALTIGLAFVDALAKMERQSATNSLLRHAVWAPSEEVRYAACSALKQRSLYGYVPHLLEALSMPIESTFHLRTDRSGSVYYYHELFREGALSDSQVTRQSSLRQVDLQGGPRRLNRLEKEIWLRNTADHAARQLVKNANSAKAGFEASLVRTEQQVEQTNRATFQHNLRIAAVLEHTTNQQLGADPRRWWEWWQSHNEFYVPEERPTYIENYVDNSTNYVRPPCSCFAAGTPVWTKSGQRPIEKLEIGDLVLSQDVRSGELCFQPIIGRTLRPPSEILKFDNAGEQLRTTLGHPMWVAGEGWRMAKEIEAGDVLHTVGGPAAVSSIASDGEEQAYNLVVANTSNYFVGEKGILVHDNTPRPPTRVRVPGMVNAND